MNAIANIEPQETGLDWKPNVERLRADCEVARASGRPDPWAIIEAECWLDLIDAELTAQSTRANPVLCEQLNLWRQEITTLVAALRSLAAESAKGRVTSFSDAAVSHRAGEESWRVPDSSPLATPQ